MNALRELEKLIDEGDVSFVLMGNSIVEQGKRHVGINNRKGTHVQQGVGDTLEQAIAAAVAGAKPRVKAVDVTPLEDLLG